MEYANNLNDKTQQKWNFDQMWAPALSVGA